MSSTTARRARPKAVKTPAAKPEPLARQSKVSDYFDKGKRQSGCEGKRESTWSPRALPSTTLPLPATYTQLSDTFRALDTCAAILHARAQRITWTAVQPNVQTLTRRDFHKTHVAQMRTVYPESYDVSLEALRRRPGEHANGTAYELVLKPNLTNDLMSSAQARNVVYTPVKSPTKARCTSPIASPNKAMLATVLSPTKLTRSPMKKTPTKFNRSFLHYSPIKLPSQSPATHADLEDDRTRLTAQRQLCRHAIFDRRLLTRVMSAHRSFMLSLDPPTVLTSADDVATRRWHPSFDVDKHCAAIELSAMPLPPKTDAPKTAVDLLSSMRAKSTQARVAANMRMALSATLGDRKLDLPADVKDKPPSTTPSGVSPSLLAKIRAKQAAKASAALTVDPVHARRLGRLRRLEQFVRITKMYYMSEAKNSLPLPTIADKLVHSYKGTAIAREEVVHHIDLMAELLPKFVQRHSLGGGRDDYIKCAHRQPIEPIIDTINKAIALMNG